MSCVKEKVLMKVNIKKNLLIFNMLFIVYGFSILVTNIIYQNYLIDFEHKCETPSEELVTSIVLAEYSLITLIAVGSFNLMLALIGIYAVLVDQMALLFLYGVLLFMLFTVELIVIAIVFASFKNFTEHEKSCGQSADQLINDGFFVCTSFLGSITITVGVFQIIAISNGCTLAERLRIDRMRDNRSVISVIFSENIYFENNCKSGFKSSKIYYL